MNELHDLGLHRSIPGQLLRTSPCWQVNCDGDVVPRPKEVATAHTVSYATPHAPVQLRLERFGKEGKGPHANRFGEGVGRLLIDLHSAIRAIVIYAERVPALLVVQLQQITQ